MGVNVYIAQLQITIRLCDLVLDQLTQGVWLFRLCRFASGLFAPWLFHPWLVRPLTFLPPHLGRFSPVEYR